MDTGIKRNRRDKNLTKQPTALKMELTEKEFYIQVIKARMEVGEKLNSETIARIHRLQLEVKKLEKLKDSLTHMIVHDLNNPLTAISGRLQLLEADKENLNEKQKKDLNAALLASANLKRMISDLLDINKMEEGKVKLNYEVFKIGELAQEMVEEMNIVAQDQGKTISLEVAEGLPEIYADKELIRRVIANLINNAIKHSPAKHAILVKFFFKKKDNSLYAQVKDSGPGIPEEYLDMIFDKFFQVEDEKAKMGRGLGLTFCRIAVEAHGGRIWAESEIGKGSTFYFTLPANIT